jgi:phenylpropionate dioxygenase-like ring-hydroxylating dioxygenase large terminal subunit
MIWLYYGNNEDSFLITPIDLLHKEFNANYSFTSKIWFSHITRCIENQLDYTHLPHIHHNTIGRNFHMPLNPKFIKSTSGIKIFHRDDTKYPASEYIFPNAWILHISNKLKMVVYFVPISENKTLFYLYTYRKFLNNILFKKLFNFMFNYSNKIILKQDQKVVASQGDKPSFLVKKEILMRHDTAIRMFRELWQEKM